MQPKASKTAIVFHATDDAPEVRREVFALLVQHPLRFLAVVRDKEKVVEYVRQRNQTDPTYRYNPNELYDYMVRRLFKTRLHKDAGYNIYFAKRGKADRTAALKDALATARQRFSERWGINSSAPINVIPAIPKEHGGLQAVDYFLWALQRLYEKGDDRYVPYLWDKISVVHDIDDTRTTRYGVYYTRKKPLTQAVLKKDQGI